MLTITHLLMGATIGKYIQNIPLIIIFSIISHYILDFIPHYSLKAPKEYKKGGFFGSNKRDLVKKGLEPVGSIFLISYLAFLNSDNPSFILLGAFFSFLPDLLQFIGWKYNLSFFKKYVPCPGNKFYRISTYSGWVIFQIIITLSLIVLLFL